MQDEHKEAEPSSSFPIFLKYIESTFSDDIFTVLEMGMLATTIPERSEAFLSHVLSLPSDDQVQLFRGALAQVSGAGFHCIQLFAVCSFHAAGFNRLGCPAGRVTHM